MENNANHLKLLKSRWDSFRAENKRVRIRDAARELQTTEAELLSTEIDDNTYYLSIDNFQKFIEQVLSVDKLMFLIRSDIAVHEVTVDSCNMQLKNNCILDSDNSIILDFDRNLFKHVFYQIKNHANKNLRSFQIFDSNGNASLKIYLKGKDESKFDNIGLKYKINYNYEIPPVTHLNHKIANYHSDKKVNFYFTDYIERDSRNQKKIKKESLRMILNSASDNKTPIQIHGIGPGSVQYYKGRIKNIVDYGPWINVIDRTFNLHLLEDKLGVSFLTKYSSKSSMHYYCVDFFDDEKNHILGISSIENFEDSFFDIVNKLEVIE